MMDRDATDQIFLFHGIVSFKMSPETNANQIITNMEICIIFLSSTKDKVKETLGWFVSYVFYVLLG